MSASKPISSKTRKEKSPCHPLSAQFKVAPRTSFLTQKYHKCGWLSWSPVFVQFQASFRVCAPRLPLTGPPWPPLAGLLVTVDTHQPPAPPWEEKEPTDVLFSSILCFKCPLPETCVLPKPVGVSSFPTNEGQCQPCLPLPLFPQLCLQGVRVSSSHTCSVQAPFSGRLPS